MSAYYLRIRFLSSDFFSFNQQTAYEMRITDWSSDVCSSDLPGKLRGGDMRVGHDNQPPLARITRQIAARTIQRALFDHDVVTAQIGRASCRERVCQYV